MLKKNLQLHQKRDRCALKRPVSFLLQYLYFVHHAANSQRRKLLLNSLCLIACPDIRHRYCIDYSRLRHMLCPRCRIFVANI